MENQGKMRRSFIDVGKKSILFDKMFHEDKEEKSHGEESTITKEKYLASLKEERMQWKDILNSRRQQLENMKKNCTNEILEITSRQVEPYLSSDDKIFLNSEPDYLGMMASAEKYLEAVEFLERYKSDVIEHYNIIVEKIQTETDILVDHLCQNDACELCNQKNCNDSNHKFQTYLS